MKKPFSAVPLDEDTVILSQTEAKFEDLDVLFQKWHWDGITAESLIFYEDDVAHLDNVTFEATLRKSPLVAEDSKITISRTSDGFVFCNFNFVIVD
jgi:hypothetical protein